MKQIDNHLYFEKIGINFEKFMSDYDVSQRINLIFNELLPLDHISTNASIIEIGCGTGRISERLIKISNNLTVSDISKKLTRKVANRLKCKGLLGDCANLSVYDKQFDLVVSSECIEHTLEPYISLREMKRLLKNDGRLIVTTPNRLWYPVLSVSKILRLRKFDGIENWTWPFQTQKWLEKEQFVDIYFSGCHLFPWQAPFVKKILPKFDKYGKKLYPIMINYGFCAKKT